MSKLSKCIVGLALVGASTAAFSQQPDQRWYLGLSVGQGEVDIDEGSVQIIGATASSVSKDETDTAWKAFAGYRFSRNLAIEGGYMDLGEFSVRRNMTAPAIGSVAASIEATGWFVDAVGILPVGTNLELFGKLGGIYTTTEATLTTSGAVVLLGNANRERSELNLKWGLGASYSFTRNWSARIEFEQVRDIGNDETGEGDVNAWTLGVVYRF